MSAIVEVCAGSLEVAIAAESAGADRIELNVALELDGLTPSLGLIQNVCDSVALPVIVMLRPRAGNFVYSVSEWEVMESDFQIILESGATGVAFGCLDHEGRIQRSRVSRLRQLADEESDGFELVFHRAFDDCTEKDALEILAELGIQRVMTSGGASTAEQGLDKIRETVVSATNGSMCEKMGVIPAAGIHAENAKQILETGCGQIHGTFGTRNSENAVSAIAKVVDTIHS